MANISFGPTAKIIVFFLCYAAVSKVKINLW